jgi:hypothetical protein
MIASVRVRYGSTVRYRTVPEDGTVRYSMVRYLYGTVRYEIFFFFFLLQFARGWPRSSAAPRSLPPLSTSTIYPATGSGRPSGTHHPFHAIYFYLILVIYFLKLSMLVSLPEMVSTSVLHKTSNALPCSRRSLPRIWGRDRIEYKRNLREFFC